MGLVRRKRVVGGQGRRSRPGAWREGPRDRRRSVGVGRRGGRLGGRPKGIVRGVNLGVILGSFIGKAGLTYL